jgi:hypothetical protein
VKRAVVVVAIAACAIAVLAAPAHAQLLQVPKSQSFGAIAPGQGSYMSVALTNAGTAGSVTVSSATLTGPNTWIAIEGSETWNASCAGAQACTFSPALVIGPGATQYMGVQCVAPLGSAGLEVATLTFTSPWGTTQMQLSCTVDSPALQITPGSLTYDFGAVPFGNSAITTITLTNTSSGSISTSISSLSGTGSDELMVNGLGCTTGTGCTSSLDAGKSATYSVLFAPT